MADSSHVDSNIITTAVDASGNLAVSVVVTNVAESSKVESNFTADVTDHLLLSNIGTNTHPQIDAHLANASNPHSVTKAQVGLGNVDNTSDANKPVSTAQATAIGLVQTDIDTHEARVDNPHSVTKSQVGLSNADNTSDANKPVSTAQQTALNNKQPLDADLTAIAALDSTTAGALVTDGAGWIRKTYAQLKTALSLVKGDVGLGNVDNTSDANKPVSTATQTALDAKVTGPASVTDDLPMIFDGTTGKLAKSKTYAAFKTLLVLVKGDVGLGNVDNTADTAKPVSTAQAAADAAVLAASQPLDSDLTTIAGLTATTDNFMVATASAWASRTPTQARSQLGLGSIALLSTITEANITLADNTINDFTTSAHGFVPKGTNTGKFLKDDGTWASVPGGGDALTANPLSQFAATTSLQLKGVVSDETGSGALVFGTSPALVTPTGIVKGDVGLGNVTNDAQIKSADFPSSSVDSEIALFSSTTGKVLKRASTTGLLKAASGVIAAAVAGTDYYNPGGTDVAVADGGTGASTAATARTNLGVGKALLTSGTVSSAATLDIVLTSYTAYKGIEIILSGFRPATDASTLFMRTSTNGGSSYDAGASDYSWALKFSATNGIEGRGSDDLDSEIELGFGVGNATTRGGNWSIELLNQISTAFYSRIKYESAYMDSSGVGLWVGGVGFRLAAQDTDAIRFLFSSGNIAEGNYAVYGYN